VYCVHSPNLQQVELFQTNGDRILMPMMYCLCLTMECSLSTGKHNTKKISKLSHNRGQNLAQGHGAVLPRRAGIRSIVQNWVISKPTVHQFKAVCKKTTGSTGPTGGSTGPTGSRPHRPTLILTGQPVFFRAPFISRISRAWQVRENNRPRKFE